MGGKLKKISEKQFVTASSALITGALVGTETGREILTNPGIYARAAIDTVMIVGQGIYDGTAAMADRPDIAVKCFPIGAMEALQNPIAYLAGAYKDPRKGKLTGPYITSVGLTNEEIESESCQAAITAGGMLPGIGAGWLTAKAGTKVTQLAARHIGLEFSPKTKAGKAFMGAGSIVGGITVNGAIADRVHTWIGDDERPTVQALQSVPSGPAGMH